MVPPRMAYVTFKQRADFPYGYGAEAGVLSQRQLHEEEGDAAQEQEAEVRDQERSWGM